MAKYKIAGMTVEMSPLYERTKKQAKPYLIDSSTKADITLQISNDFLYKELEVNPHLSLDDLEYIYLGQQFYYYILKHNRILLHSSAVVKDGFAYLFSANSGTGKSTHTNFWLETFSDAYILNDDKPALLIEDDKVYACGTPFSGKVDLSKNEIVPLKAIIFIERSQDFFCEKMNTKDAIYNLLAQTERVPIENAMDTILSYIEKVILNVPIYKMGVSLDKSVATKAFMALNK